MFLRIDSKTVPKIAAVATEAAMTSGVGKGRENALSMVLVVLEQTGLLFSLSNGIG